MNSLKNSLNKIIQEEDLIDSDEKEKIVKIAIYFAGSTEASTLPGFIPRAADCNSNLY